MPYTDPFVYVRAKGHFGTSSNKVEYWNTGFKIPVPLPGPSAANLSAFLVDIQTYFAAFQASAVSAGTNCFLTDLTAAYVGIDGKYVGGGAQTTTFYTYATPVAGVGTPVLPWSTAVVLSLRTPRSRGLASNGRVYWPCLGISPAGTTGVWSTAQTGAIASAAKTLIDNINSHTDPHLGAGRRVAVMSRVGLGLTATVTSVRVGGKPDAQERRERSLVEVYSSAGLATTLDELEDRRAERFSDLSL